LQIFHAGIPKILICSAILIIFLKTRQKHKILDIYLSSYRCISLIKYFSFLFFLVNGHDGKPRSMGAGGYDRILTGLIVQGPYANPAPQKPEVPVESACDGRRYRGHRNDYRPHVASGNTFSGGLRNKDPRQFSSSWSACNRAA